MIAVMVGGPAHGQAWPVPEPMPYTLFVPRRQEPLWVLDYTADGPCKPPPEPHQYALRRYSSARTPEEMQPAYLCMDDPAPKIQLPANPDENAIYYARVAEALWHEAVEATIPTCVVPGCNDKGRMTFTAAESGRLAGRNWQRGDEIRICHEHAHDVYLAQGTYGMKHLADWLKPDATWNPLDAYDAGADLLYGAEVLDRTARMLRIATRRRL